MNNKPCVSCTKPLNGGVFRRPNECPHCSVLQNPVFSACGKPLSIEQAIAASRKLRAVQKPSIKKAPTSPEPILAKPKVAKASTVLSDAQIDAQQLEARKAKARKAYAAKARILAARKAELLKQRAIKEKAIKAKLAAVDTKPVSALNTVPTKESVRSTNPFLSVSSVKNTSAAANSVARTENTQKQSQQVTSNPFLAALNKPNRANTADSFRRAARNF